MKNLDKLNFYTTLQNFAFWLRINDIDLPEELEEEFEDLRVDLCHKIIDCMDSKIDSKEKKIEN